MAFLDQVFWGLHVWVWLLILYSFLVIVGMFLYIYREHIKRNYYEFRFPERMIRVVMHYDTGIYKEFYRLIPDKEIFYIEGKAYRYDDIAVRKYNDFYTVKKGDKTIIKVGQKEYDFNTVFSIKKRKKSIVEIHYMSNNPNPVHFNFDTKTAEITSKNMSIFQKNDLFNKLLTISDTGNLMIIILIMVGANMAISFFLLGKYMEWF